MRRLSLLESLRCSTAVAGDLAMGSAASLDGPLPDLALLQQSELETSSARPPLMLQNKLPRWNEGEPGMQRSVQIEVALLQRVLSAACHH